mmetsp:Transcript_34176/g.50216  ORF Transcript_34176/g.50216 Transcript_34176/m.50216 type:complete len:223 (-) Transcript_34176:34-702(-)|eukprot:CAMPEP_0195522562 /NCGR_PEP_ID=MMETSP0794_2-20130614/20837_1 /TAXON_ID=515487 /ORGANISM="Stephanopyxis turris, Strain CCMP 815" /LENGTH=222 /DNA_ID=CAMNT_0040652345 /DNA_START=393 /DNA_END=1061 /DNA_ORIENTATION=+
MTSRTFAPCNSQTKIKTFSSYMDQGNTPYAALPAISVSSHSDPFFVKGLDVFTFLCAGSGIRRFGTRLVKGPASSRFATAEGFVTSFIPCMLLYSSGSKCCLFFIGGVSAIKCGRSHVRAIGEEPKASLVAVVKTDSSWTTRSIVLLRESCSSFPKSGIVKKFEYNSFEVVISSSPVLNIDSKSSKVDASSTHRRLAEEGKKQGTDIFILAAYFMKFKHDEA